MPAHLCNLLCLCLLCYFDPMQLPLPLCAAWLAVECEPVPPGLQCFELRGNFHEIRFREGKEILRPLVQTCVTTPHMCGFRSHILHAADTGLKSPQSSALVFFYA